MLRYKNSVLLRVVLLFCAALTCPQLEANNESSAKIVNKAKSLIDEDQVKPAFAILNKLIESYPLNAQALSERSRAYRKTGRVEKADADANRAVALAPKSAEIRINRVPMYIAAKKFKAARHECDRAILLDPHYGKAYIMRASVLERLERYDDAILDCNMAILLAPNLPDSYLRRGSCLKQKKQIELADSDFKKALGLSLKSSENNHLLRGSIYYHQNDFKETILECIADLKVNPDSSDAHYLKANAYSRLGQYQNEIDDLTEAIKLTPGELELYELRAVAEYKLFQLNAAINDCEKGLGLSPEARVKPLMAAAYDELGKHREATDIRNKLAAPGSGISPSKKTFDKLFEEQPPGKDAVLNFSYDDEGHFAVPAYVNNQKIQLMLDTGSEITDLWKSAMPQLGLEPKYDSQWMQADGKKKTSGKIRLENFALDKMQVKDIELNVDEGLANHRTIGGFLGSNVLKNFVLTIDYLEKKAIFSKSCCEDHSKKAIVVPMMLRANCPYCLVTIDDRFERPALLDTGSPFSGSADALLKPIFPKDFSYKGRMTGPWLGNISSGYIRLKRLGFPNYSVQDTLCEVFPASEAPLASYNITLGNDFLSRFKSVTFDFPGRRVIFEPNEYDKESAWDLMKEARFCFQKNDDRQGISYLNQFMLADPEGGKKALYHRARAFMRLNEFENALEDLDQFISLYPEDAPALVARAYIHGAFKDYKKQIEDDTAAIKLNPNFKAAYENRAWALDVLGEKELAESDREKSKGLE